MAADSSLVLEAAQAPAHSVNGEIRDRYTARRAQVADEALRALWQSAGLPAGVALVAVGGFGRGELFPHSDVDVLLLLPDGISCDHDARLQQRVEAFIYGC